ncbi:MAG: hypothetical protein Q4D61_07240 [Cardiobacteriaceae bacterium]|nr:hypothetical protein [Cardiobacteriaceae bacterium]
MLQSFSERLVQQKTVHTATQCLNPPSDAAAGAALLAEKRAWVFERSEFPSPPPKALANAEKLRPWGRLSLVPKQKHVLWRRKERTCPRSGARAAAKRNLEERRDSDITTCKHLDRWKPSYQIQKWGKA